MNKTKPRQGIVMVLLLLKQQSNQPRDMTRKKVALAPRLSVPSFAIYYYYLAIRVMENTRKSMQGTKQRCIIIITTTTATQLTSKTSRLAVLASNSNINCNYIIPSLAGEMEGKRFS